MCTLAIAWRVFEDAPVVAAANRDEAFDRPSDPPVVLQRDPPVIAPRDREAGGTWIGLRGDGRFVAITNRWDGPRDGERSRGLLVRDALLAETTGEVLEGVETAVTSEGYAGFNLLVADDESAEWFAWNGELRRRSFEPGLHVLVNVGADGSYRLPPDRRAAGRRQAESAEAVRTALDPDGIDGASAWLDRAATVLADHDVGACVHGDGFGTRSSSLVRTGRTPTYRFADGPPCRTPYRSVPLEGHD